MRIETDSKNPPSLTSRPLEPSELERLLPHLQAVIQQSSFSNSLKVIAMTLRVEGAGIALDKRFTSVVKANGFLESITNLFTRAVSRELTFEVLEGEEVCSRFWGLDFKAESACISVRLSLFGGHISFEQLLEKLSAQ